MLMFVWYYEIADYCNIPLADPRRTIVKCDNCGKTPMFGHNVSHSKRHTNRSWTPNIHPARIMIEGKMKRVNLCTRCLRTYDKSTAV